MTTSPVHLPEQIVRYHERLNREGVVPGVVYRRNHLAYPLVSYVNHIVACLHASNHDVVALFLSRAAGEFSRLRSAEMKRPAEELAYFDLLEEYLTCVSHFVLAQGVAEPLIAEIPAAWRPPGGGN